MCGWMGCVCVRVCMYVCICVRARDGGGIGEGAVIGLTRFHAAEHFLTFCVDGLCCSILHCVLLQ